MPIPPPPSHMKVWIRHCVLIIIGCSRTQGGLIGSLSKDVFERRTSTGSEAFSLFICLDTTKFVLLSFFSPIKTIYPRVSTKPQSNAAKSPLPVDVRRCVYCVSLIKSMLRCWVVQYSETRPLHRVQYHQTEVIQPSWLWKWLPHRLSKRYNSPIQDYDHQDDHAPPSNDHNWNSCNWKLAALAWCWLF